MTAEKTCKNKLDAFSSSDDDAVDVLCVVYDRNEELPLQINKYVFTLG